jgi:hypothetical protein
MGVYPGVQTPVTLDEPDANVVPVRALGHWLGVGFVECVGLVGGFLGDSTVYSRLTDKEV